MLPVWFTATILVRKLKLMFFIGFIFNKYHQDYEVNFVFDGEVMHTKGCDEVLISGYRLMRECDTRWLHICFSFIETEENLAFVKILRKENTEGARMYTTFFLLFNPEILSVYCER